MTRPTNLEAAIKRRMVHARVASTPQVGVHSLHTLSKRAEHVFEGSNGLVLTGVLSALGTLFALFVSHLSGTLSPGEVRYHEATKLISGTSLPTCARVTTPGLPPLGHLPSQKVQAPSQHGACWWTGLHPRQGALVKRSRTSNADDGAGVRLAAFPFTPVSCAQSLTASRTQPSPLEDRQRSIRRHTADLSHSRLSAERPRKLARIAILRITGLTFSRYTRFDSASTVAHSHNLHSAADDTALYFRRTVEQRRFRFCATSE